MYKVSYLDINKKKKNTQKNVNKPCLNNSKHFIVNTHIFACASDYTDSRDMASTRLLRIRQSYTEIQDIYEHIEIESDRFLLSL